ncbi:MAG TPA: glycine--tRNA ligase subunit alpha [Armatimonadota bacterium]|nr:glycine--tRNA ligase subunit alpha [Armatimonadota bacterium]
MTFQEIIRTLEEYWARQGCVIEQPYDVEVAAGTMHPSTFLRTLGPEPWKVAYVQPSRRPADSRYGENPYRLYRHFQYQVMLKPSPDNIQELYLDSLRALGFDPRQHDVRFMDDNWEITTLGAAGAGWQVWLDGLEITQFTYFQSAGGIDLSPVSVELAYGLERICMAVQRVQHYQDIRWNDTLTYGQIYRQSESAWGRYNFQLADPQLLQTMFDDYERVAYRLLDEDDVIPAYDFTLKCSHTFNVLDARGVISVMQRIGYIDRVRELSRRCVQEFVRQREALGFPLLTTPTPPQV